MARETSPCRAETALARRASLKPSTVMQNSSLLIAGILASQFHQLLVRDAQRIAQRPEMLFDQFGVKPVVAGGHRSVGGEDHFAGNPADGLVKANAFVLHAVANRFQHGESAVAFVQVQNAGGDSHGLESAETSDPQAAIPGGCECARLRHKGAR